MLRTPWPVSTEPLCTSSMRMESLWKRRATEPVQVPLRASASGSDGEAPHAAAPSTRPARARPRARGAGRTVGSAPVEVDVDVGVFAAPHVDLTVHGAVARPDHFEVVPAGGEAELAQLAAGAAEGAVHVDGGVGRAHVETHHTALAALVGLAVGRVAGVAVAVVVGAGLTLAL